MSELTFMYNSWKKPRHAVYQCSCGKVCEKRKDHVKNGNTRSCGHLALAGLTRSNVKHGHALSTGRSRTYQSWLAMRRRCTDPNSKDFKDYGARGITVCERWLNDFSAFLADMGERQFGMTIDREDVNGNYTPENCHWATNKAQIHNRRISRQKA